MVDIKIHEELYFCHTRMIKELNLPENKVSHLPLMDADVYFYPRFFDKVKAEEYFHLLKEEIRWQQDEIKIFGKVHQQPRLTSLFAVNQKSYSYSNITMHPHPFSAELLDIKNKIEEVTGEKFTTCLANLYRTGKDSMGWHADDEKELGQNPVIASLSLGQERMFHFKHKKNPEHRFKINLNSGSLLLMKGPTQHCWLHQVPKTSRPIEPRINLTFRRID